jgi:FkbM family methyltransferase
MLKATAMTESTNTARSSALDKVLLELESEPLVRTLERERTAFDRIAGPFSDSLVLFGAGFLGRFTLAGLRKAGLQPLAFSDNNPSLWGSSIDGLEVLSPLDAAAKYGEKAAFVVTIYHGTSVREQLSRLSCRSVVPFPLLFWKYADVFIPSSGLQLPHKILEHSAEIREGYSVLSDEASKREFCEQLRWRFLLDYECLSPHQDGRETYFPSDLIVPLDDEVFVDCGAFDGDSIRSFLHHRNHVFGHIYAVEPDPANRLALENFIASLPGPLKEKFSVLPFAVGNCNEAVSFNAESSAASRISADSGTGEVECRRLDDLLAEVEPTYIKMDIEGAEPEAILGAAGILKNCAPVLAACVYHRCEHLWRIPLLIHSISPSHRIFLRRYAEECWEMVGYAVPPERLNSNGSYLRTELREGR